MPLTDGDLQHRIRIESPITVTDRYGHAEITGWKTVAHVWAKRSTPLAATSTALAGGAETHRELVRFDLRPRPLQPDWRIVDARNGQAFTIQTIALNNERSELAILAIAGLGGA